MEFSTSTYVFFFIILIIIIILIFIFIYLNINPKKPLTLGLINLQPPSNVTSTLGASNNGLINLNNGNSFMDITTCNNQNNSIWVNSCTCIVPYYSSDCSIQSYDLNYTAIGQINDNQVITTEYNTENNNFLSFNQNSCTNKCDIDNQCIGVKWQNNICTLLKDNFIVKEGEVINYDLYKQANYYLKNNIPVELKDRVIVYTGVQPLRYWIPTTFSNSAVNFMNALFENIQYPLNYRPLWLINNTDGWVGLVSNTLIVGDYQDLYNNPPDNIIPIPFETGTTNLMDIIPAEWNTVHIVFFQLV